MAQDNSFQWAGLDQTTERKPKTDETASLCKRVFSTEDGQKLLVWLREKFKDQVIADPAGPAQHAYFKEGQRDVVRYIETLIKRADQK